MQRRKQLSKFTYGARTIEREEKIGAWENFVGTCFLLGAVSLCCLSYFVAGVIVVVLVTFGGRWLFYALGGS